MTSPTTKPDTGMAHTARPWMVDPDRPTEFLLDDRDDLDVTPMIGCVFTTDGTGEDIEGQAKADTAFLVRAVNCHDELVAALKNAREAIAETLADNGYDITKSARLKAIDAIIARAEGRQP